MEYGDSRIKFDSGLEHVEMRSHCDMHKDVSKFGHGVHHTLHTMAFGNRNVVSFPIWLYGTCGKLKATCNFVSTRRLGSVSLPLFYGNVHWLASLTDVTRA
jgi:hypothetical protein